jgi:hypothetical protein
LQRSAGATVDDEAEGQWLGDLTSAFFAEVKAAGSRKIRRSTGAAVDARLAG